MSNGLRLWIIAGGFGGALFAMNLAFGAGLTYASGQPGLSGLVTGFTTAFVLFGVVAITRRFGAVTIAFTLYCLLAVPTVLMGPPGIYKILVGFAAGLALDIVLYVAKYRFVGFLIGFVGYVAVLLVGTYGAFMYLNLPQIERFRSAMLALAAIFTVQGWVGAWASRKFLVPRIKSIPAFNLMGGSRLPAIEDEGGGRKDLPKRP